MKANSIKLYVRYFYIIFALFVVIMSIFFAQTDWVYLFNHQNKYIEKEKFIYINTSSINFQSKIIDALSNAPEMELQRGITGIPALSTLPILTKLGLLNVHLTNNLIYSKNFESQFYKLLDMYGNQRFGGIILFDNNFTQFKNRDELRSWIDKLIYQNTVTINFSFNDNKRYKVKIKPIVAMDCDLNYKGFYRYCRGIKYGVITQDLKYPLSEEAINRMFSDVSNNGINTLLSPDVDTHKRENDLISDYAVEISRKLSNQKLFPVLKHFAYRDDLLNTHEGSMIINYSPSEFEYVMRPYIKVENLGLPYAIMVTHHRLQMDPNVPLPMSEKVNKYIRERFPNSITISDEIKMKGLSSYDKSIQNIVKNLQTDMYIVHSGNINFKVSDIIIASKNNPNLENKNHLKRVLQFKKKIDLLKIEEIN